MRAIAWPLAAALAAAWHFASFPWRDHPLATDVRHYLYFAQQTAAGALPYLDFFDYKTPLATFLGAGLYRLGGWLGVEPLFAIRWGYLAMAAAAATLAFLVHRTLAGGAVAAGALAVAFHCGFWLLGTLPCIGNVPKLAMAIFAAASALAVHHRSWIAAGFLAALAALDWQIGVLAALGVLVAAFLEPAGARARAAARVVLGGVLAALPVLVLYAARGALGPLFRQTVVASLFRGEATREAGGSWAQRWEVVVSGTEGHTWLVAVAAVGILVYLLWLRSARAREVRGLAAALGLYHAGVLGFSLRDFQLYGDLFVLLHTACFFAAVAAGEAWLWLDGRLGPRRPAWTAAVAVAAGLAIARPWVDRGTLRVPGLPSADVTVLTQRAVTAQLAPLLARPTTAVRGVSEQLYLSGKRNPLPFLVWNAAVYRYFRLGPQEDRVQALERLHEQAGITHLVCDHASRRCAGLGSYQLVRTVGDPSRYAVDVYARRRE